jgi:hypothetical protein
LPAGVPAMLLRQLERESGVFDPETLKAITTAYDAATRKLGLADTVDDLTAIIAARIIEAAKAGERDADRLQERALEGLSPA